MALLDHILAPYPKGESRRDRVLYALGTGIFVVLFLVFFQPFGTREYESDSKYFFLAGYGLAVALGMGFFTLFLPALMPRIFREEAWTVGKHILLIWLTFCVSIFLCYAYKQWYFNLPLGLADFGYFGLLSASIAIFPISGLVLANYIRRLKHYQEGSGKVNIPSQENTMTVELFDEYGKVSFRAPANDIFFIQSADNYAEIFHLQGEVVNRQLIRHSLKALEEQLSDTSLTRCHRSYIVNLDLVESISGNAQGYRFHLKEPDLSVPVSRSRSQLVKEFKLPG